MYNVDSGTTNTLVCSTTSVEKPSTIAPTSIHLADDSLINATSIGTVKTHLNLPPIQGLVVPTLTENLLSVGQLADNGVFTLFGKNKVEFFEGPVNVEGVKVGEGLRENRKYMVRPPTTSKYSSSASLLTWHTRLSHLGEPSIQRLHQQGVIEVNDWERGGLENCDGCKRGKMARRKFGSRAPYKATCRLEVVHSDVCQLSIKSRNGSRYFVTFIDDYTKFSTVYHIRHKFQVFECFQHFVRQAERETTDKVMELRSDNGGEYVSQRMRDWCKLMGIKQTMGPPHTPQLNGVAERYNRTLLDRLKPSLKHSKLHHEFWTDALDYAV